MRHLRLTESELNAMRAKGKRVDLMHVKTGRPMGKYGNKKTIVDGIEFDSRKEAKRWQELMLLESSGIIGQLKRQVRYDLNVGVHHIAEYVADFVYHDGLNPILAITVEDVKGYKKGAAYAMFRLKAKLMLACYGVEVKEI